jgi:polyisoprenoid-binding protein YceI
MIGRIRGRFRALDGSASIGADPLASSVQVVIDASSFESGNDQRDQAIVSEEFLDAKTYPELRYQSTGIRQQGDAHVMDGELTVRDVTRPVELPFTYNGFVKDPFGNDRIGISASGQIEREDFGLTANIPLESGGVVVGPTIRLDLEVQFVRSAD